MWHNFPDKFFIQFDVHEKWEDRKETFYASLDYIIHDSYDIGYSDMIILFDTEDKRNENVKSLNEHGITEFSIGVY